MSEVERAFEGDVELVGDDEARRLGGGVQGVDPAEVRSPTEVARPLAQIDLDMYRTLFLTAALTGMRSGELFALRWSDVELTSADSNHRRGKLHVRRSLSWARVRTGGEDKREPIRPRFYPPKREIRQARDCDPSRACIGA